MENKFKHDMELEPAKLPITVEEYKRQEELKAKVRQEERLQTLTDAALTIVRMVGGIAEKMHKNMQASVNFKPEINYNPETIDIDNFVKEVKKQIDKGFFFVEDKPPVRANTEKKREHLNHPFYKKVDEITEKVAMQQILKGAEKYDEPFNPASWTGEQLVNHGLQEARDLQVYLVGLAEHIERIEKENRSLRTLEKEQKISLGEWKFSYEQLQKTTKEEIQAERLAYSKLWDEKNRFEREVKSLKDEVQSLKVRLNIHE